MVTHYYGFSGLGSGQDPLHLYFFFSCCNLES